MVKRGLQEPRGGRLRRHETGPLKWLATAAVVGLGLAGCQPGGTSAAEEAAEAIPSRLPDEATPPSVDEVLESMIAFMSGSTELWVRAQVSYQVLQETGQIVHFDRTHAISLARPDRLFWETIRDDASADSVWFSDGVLSMLKRPDDVYAQVELPATVPEMVDELVSVYNVRVPLSDLLAGHAREIFMTGPTEKWYIGQAWVDGGWTHHMALRNEELDFEVWVRSEGDPVPVRFAITWVNDEGAPTYVARFRDWNFSPSFDDATFRFTTPADAERVQILPVPIDPEY
jgi:hypothetical protein